MAEFNIINLTEIENFKDLTADFYRNEYVELSNITRSFPYKRLSNIAYITDGEHGSPCWSKDSGIKYITAEYIKENFIEDGNYKQITEEQDRRNERARLKLGDILIYSVGAYAGLTAVAEPHLFPANIPRSVAIIRLHNFNEFTPEFISIFLNSKYGKYLSLRFRAGNSQPVIALEKFRQFEIPLVNIDFQKSISDLYNKAYKKRLESRNLYKQAEDLLNKELGLDTLVFDKPKSYVANFSEVQTSRRFNPEYFSPLIQKILELPIFSNCVKLSLYYEIKRGKSPSQYYSNGIPVLKTKNIRIPDIDFEKVNDYVEFNDNYSLTREKDLILASMGVGSLGRVSFVNRGEDNVVIDGTLRILRKKNNVTTDIEIPTLLYLTSKIGQELIYRGIVGSTGIISLPDNYLSKIPLPNFSSEFCRKINELVISSMEMKKKSKELLEEAKKQVEDLIENQANQN